MNGYSIVLPYVSSLQTIHNVFVSNDNMREIFDDYTFFITNWPGDAVWLKII